MLSKLQATIWIGSIAGRLKYKGVNQNWVALEDGDEWLYLDNPNAFVRLRFAEVEGKEVWLMEVRVYAPSSAQYSPTLIRKFDKYVAEEWPEFIEDMALVQDAQGVSVVRVTVRLYEKEPFKQFSASIGEFEMVAYSIAQALDD